ncbi:MAG: tryptophan--tRNA ligase [Egibacteraceae bacterium]
MARVFSGIQPTGDDPHLGNYLGAFARWAAEQEREHVFCIVDLHAMTLPYEPRALTQRTLDMASWLFAAGLDPDVATVFVQSHVREHSECAWVLNCVATTGELGRMVQFKEKSKGRESVSVGLFDYPVLQAADILLYQAEEVPVGDDQRQHVELTRDLAQRFNNRFGKTFTVPRATLPGVGARVMDLQLPDRKMSKSSESPAGTIVLAETEEETRKKIMRAVTDSASEIRAAPEKPGVTNLLELFAAVTGGTIEELEQRYAGKGYGDLKRDLAEAVNGALRPVRQRQAELRTDPGELAAILRKGAERARGMATETMATVRERVGLLSS